VNITLAFQGDEQLSDAWICVYLREYS
jgi:hypothetical protein